MGRKKGANDLKQRKGANDLKQGSRSAAKEFETGNLGLKAVVKECKLRLKGSSERVQERRVILVRSGISLIVRRGITFVE